MRKLKLLLLGVLMLCTQLISAQTRDVTGKVTDGNGSPLNGASIRVKGSRGGVSAASDGTFTIKAAPNAVLIVSAVGYEAKEINIGSETNVNASLPLDTKALSEVVVTGTGSAVSKKKLAFAVETVNLANQTKVPTVPGAYLVRTSTSYYAVLILLPVELLP
jgi:TonB-dependent starch-binding outer membrane protein SusC